MTQEEAQSAFGSLIDTPVVITAKNQVDAVVSYHATLKGFTPSTYQFIASVGGGNLTQIERPLAWLMNIVAA